MSAGYDWEEGAANSAYYDIDVAKIRLWTLLATLLSVCVHIALFFLFRAVHVDRLATPSGDSPRDRLVRLGRVAVDSNLLEKSPATPEDSLAAAVSRVLDQSALETTVGNPGNSDDKSASALFAKQLAGEVGLDARKPSPRANDGSGGLAATLDISDLARAAGRSLRNDLTPAGIVSPEQAIIALESEPVQLDDGATELLDKLARETARRVPSVAGVPEGYADLDDVLSSGGKDIDLSKPFLVSSDILFGYDDATVQNPAKLSLMKLAYLIEKTHGITFSIEGHTDSFGPAPYNQDLSERRARAVRNWLVGTLKVSSARLSTRGWGKRQPIADPSGTVEEQALNRRVEIFPLAPGR